MIDGAPEVPDGFPDPKPQIVPLPALDEREKLEQERRFSQMRADLAEQEQAASLYSNIVLFILIAAYTLLVVTLCIGVFAARWSAMVTSFSLSGLCVFVTLTALSALWYLERG